jgi:copper chaperone CopZ
MIAAFTITSCAQKKPEQATPITQPQNAATQKIKISVDGMVCNACQSTVKKTIRSINGVSDVEVNLEKKFALFTYDPKKVKVEQVQKAINDQCFSNYS